VGERAADGAAVAHLGVADLAGGGVGEQRHVLAQQSLVSRSMVAGEAPMATWSPSSRM
jgi:hypothetical protein